MDLHSYDKAVKEYRKWLYFGRPLDYLGLSFLTLKNQWDWFRLLDNIANGKY